uniref:Chitin-binding type-2 domain-containing protein n=1 Tax=Timema tahoe TaxID=61484 RepID=A0A7R9IRP9_9NEOP|nr:unnamed protein product [Timema tahoe]
MGIYNIAIGLVLLMGHCCGDPPLYSDISVGSFSRGVLEDPLLKDVSESCTHNGYSCSKDCQTVQLCANQVLFNVTHCKNGTFCDAGSPVCTDDDASCTSPDDLPFLCCNIGLFPDLNNCSKYYLCDSDVSGATPSHSFTCPAGSVFDSGTLSCSGTVACSESRAPDCSVNPTGALRDNPSLYYVCSLYPGMDTEYAQVPRLALQGTTSGPFQCHFQGIFSDPESCTSFIACPIDLVPQRVSCPDGWHFDGQSMTCIHEPPIPLTTPLPPSGRLLEAAQKDQVAISQLNSLILLSVIKCLVITVINQAGPILITQLQRQTLESVAIPSSQVNSGLSWIRACHGHTNNCIVRSAFYDAVRSDQMENLVLKDAVSTCNDTGYFCTSDCKTVQLCAAERLFNLTHCPGFTFCDAANHACADDQTSCPNWRPPAFTCCDHGLFPDLYNCSRYYLCYKDQFGSKPEVYECEEGTAFDVETLSCTLNGGCAGSRAPVCSLERPTGALRDNPSIYYVCTLVDGVMYPQLCRCDQGYYDPMTTSCVTTSGEVGTTSSSGPDEFRCLEQGIFGDPESCEAYYVCSLSLQATHGFCVNGTHFNQTRHSCVLGTC